MRSQTTFSTGGADVRTELFQPPGSAKRAAIVIAHGSDGMSDTPVGAWGTMIRGYAEDLAGAGFAVSIPHFFQSTGDDPGPVSVEQILAHRAQWQSAITDAIAHVKTLPSVDPSRIALIGFSLGGHLSLRLRATSKVLVEFFAPELDGIGPAANAGLKAQIHHGLADGLVDFESNAAPIQRQLTAEGASSTLIRYAGAGHGFVGADPANTKARADAKANTLAFCKKHL